jgi:hypothetical protein
MAEVGTVWDVVGGGSAGGVSGFCSVLKHGTWPPKTAFHSKYPLNDIENQHSNLLHSDAHANGSDFAKKKKTYEGQHAVETV